MLSAQLYIPHVFKHCDLLVLKIMILWEAVCITLYGQNPNTTLRIRFRVFGHGLWRAGSSEHRVIPSKLMKRGWKYPLKHQEGGEGTPLKDNKLGAVYSLQKCRNSVSVSLLLTRLMELCETRRFWKERLVYICFFFLVVVLFSDVHLFNWLYFRCCDYLYRSPQHIHAEQVRTSLLLLFLYSLLALHLLIAWLAGWLGDVYLVKSQTTLRWQHHFDGLCNMSYSISVLIPSFRLGTLL